VRAVIMAGGAGTRLSRGEKPLVSVCGQPMLSRVIDAFLSAGCEPFVAVSPQTPMTLNWCRAHGIPAHRTTGAGYIEDMVETVTALEETRPVIVSVSDIPCIDAGCIRAILEAYHLSGRDACSTWIPASLARSCRESMPYRETIGDTEACPAGVNILRGDLIAVPQDEYRILSRNPRLSLNVNTSADLAAAESFLECR
jgi:adenosylcobinamide-phosphate guanylyltransferase